jgi:dipeptidyl aminopeptidase/acylaminoacyl peptidase
MNAQIAQFPGTKSETKSPDGRYAIQNRDSENTDPAHVLFLLDKTNGSKTLIHPYGRSVDILWSPKSDAFVINDHEGSNSARPLLYSLPWNDTKIDLLESLTVFLRGRHQENVVVGNDHVYLLARRWINSTEILCRLEGYGEASPTGSGFTRYYLYKIGDGFRPYKPKGQPN